jgi:DNA repair exonuclease SbcCD ATPase subunit
MRKAFDANVPKLKPRLRPAMAVVSGTMQDKRNEDTNITIDRAISQNDINLQDDVLNPDTANISEQESEANDSFPDVTDDEPLVETSSDTRDGAHIATHEETDEIDRNSAAISSAALRNSETGEKKSERSDNFNLQEQVATINQDSADEQIMDTTQMDIAGNQEQLTENPNSAAPETLPGIQSIASESITIPPVAPVIVIDDSEVRRKRLEDVKRKVSDAMRPEVRIEPVPEDPVLAVESVLGLVNDLETQLSRSREVEKALRNELAEAKADLASTVNDGRTASGRLLQVEAQLDEKRNVLEEMLFEMGALEEERDQAVRMVQMLTIKEKERQQELGNLRQQLAELKLVVDENRVEEERLSGELDEYVKENTRFHTLLTEITKERDILLCNAELLTKERDDLLKAKKALEKVHNALSQARARLRE